MTHVYAGIAGTAVHDSSTLSSFATNAAVGLIATPSMWQNAGIRGSAMLLLRGILQNPS